MNPFDLILGACAAFAAAYGLDALQAHLRRRHHDRGTP